MQSIIRLSRSVLGNRHQSGPVLRLSYCKRVVADIERSQVLLYKKQVRCKQHKEPQVAR